MTELRHRSAVSPLRRPLAGRGVRATQRLPLVDGMLALSAYFASILIAAQLDRPERAGLSEVLSMLRAHAFEILVFAAIIAIAGAVIWMLLLAPPGVRQNVVRQLEERSRHQRQVETEQAELLPDCAGLLTGRYDIRITADDHRRRTRDGFLRGR